MSIKRLTITLRVLEVIAALAFLAAGSAKLSGAQQMVDAFAKIGVGQWFRYVTGIFEVTGAVLLLIPSLAGVGALLLAGVMAGAIVAHLTILGGSPVVPAVLLLIVGGVAWFRRERTARLLLHR
jgi:putative oxidoreductase